MLRLRLNNTTWVKVMNKITEIIPDDVPEWVSEAIQDGQFFRVAIERAEGQTKKASLIETIFGLSAGFLIAWASWIFPIPQLFGIEASRSVAIAVTLYFTVLSFLRGYGVRRLFNYLHNRGNKNV